MKKCRLKKDVDFMGTVKHSGHILYYDNEDERYFRVCIGHGVWIDLIKGDEASNDGIICEKCGREFSIREDFDKCSTLELMKLCPLNYVVRDQAAIEDCEMFAKFNRIRGYYQKEGLAPGDAQFLFGFIKKLGVK